VNAGTWPPSTPLIENPRVKRIYTYSSDPGVTESIAGLIGPVSGVSYILDSIDSGVKYVFYKRNLDDTHHWTFSLTGVTFGKRWMTLK
jgi:hypothetical protein